MLSDQEVLIDVAKTWKLVDTKGDVEAARHERVGVDL